MTLVAGQVVVRDGRLISIDEDAIRAEIFEAMKESKENLKKIYDHAERLMPYYSAMLKRSANTEIDAVLGGRPLS